MPGSIPGESLTELELPGQDAAGARKRMGMMPVEHPTRKELVMLCLSRKMRTSTSNGESLTFTTEAGERIVVHFGERHGNILEVRIDAPKSVRIERTDNKQKGAADASN